MNTIGSAANVPPVEPAPAGGAGGPSTQSWNSATANAQASANQQAAQQMVGAVGMTIMMPQIMKAFSAGQDEDS